MKKGDLIIVGSALLLLIGLFIGYRVYLSQAGEGRFAVLSINGNEYQRFELNDDLNMEIKVEQDNEAKMIRIYNNGILVLETENTYHIEYEDAYNLIHIKNGGIQIVEDNSPHQIAVRKGFTKRVFDPLICLPYRLEVEIIADEPSDADDISG